MGKSKRKNKKSNQQANDNSNNRNSNSNNHNNNNNNNKGRKSNDNSNNKHKKDKKDDYSFRQKLEINGEREIIEMSADGNCLFRSISHQLHNDYGNNHETIRNEICDYLQDNEDDFKVYLLLEDINGNESDDVCDFQEYIDQMRMNGEWGGDVEIVCASRLYKRTITIFSNVGAYNISIDNEEEKSGPDLLLSYHDNMHYNSVHDNTRASSNGSNSKSNSKNNSARDIAHSKKASENDRKSTRKKRSNKSDVAITEKSTSKDDKMKSTTMNNTTTDDQNNEKKNENEEKINNEEEKSKHGKKYSKRQNVQKRNDVCSCGSGLRYKKCCLAEEKNRIRLEKFREKHGLGGSDKKNDDGGYQDSVNRMELEGGFAVLNI